MNIKASWPLESQRRRSVILARTMPRAALLVLRCAAQLRGGVVSHPRLPSRFAVRAMSCVLTAALLAGCVTTPEPSPPQEQHHKSVSSWRLGADSVATGRAGAVYQTGAREHVATRRPAGAVSEKGGD